MVSWHSLKNISSYVKQKQISKVLDLTTLTQAAQHWSFRLWRRKIIKMWTWFEPCYEKYENYSNLYQSIWW